MGVEKEGEMRKYMSAHDTYYAYVRKDTANEKWLWLSQMTALLSIHVHLSPGSSCGLLAYASVHRYYNFPHICG